MATVSILPEVTAFLKTEHRHFIEGQAQAADKTLSKTLFNPATGETLTKTVTATEIDLNNAINSAHQAFVDQRWSGMRPADRERILMRLADLMETQREVIAQIETLNQGKSIHVSRAIDAGATAEYIRYIAGWTTKLTGETFDVSVPAPKGQKFSAYTLRHPIGVVAAIAPWNFPLAIATWKVLPALAAGCTVVLKPSSETPLTALYFAHLAKQAGVPDGVFNVLVGAGGEIGEKLVSHPTIRKVSFTGSTSVGIRVGQAALSHVAYASLELGGKNPMIIMNDVPVDTAVAGIMAGGFLNSGQVCAAASRIYIHRQNFDAIVATLKTQVAQLIIGPGLDENAQIQPLTSKHQQKSVLAHIEKARDQGNKILCGGSAPDLPGYYVQPTLIIPNCADDHIVQEEVFGPVLALIPFDDTENMLAQVNHSHYGLAASVWTNNVKTMHDLIRRIDSGIVWVNNHIPLDPALPFGGTKYSGIGRDFGRASVESFTEVKSVCILH